MSWCWNLMQLSLAEGNIFLLRWLKSVGGYPRAQALRHWTFTTEAQIQPHANPCRIYAGQSSIGTNSPSWVLSCMFNHLPLTLYILCSWQHHSVTYKFLGLLSCWKLILFLKENIKLECYYISERHSATKVQ